MIVFEIIGFVVVVALSLIGLGALIAAVFDR